jgi:methyl-accepting chemotaxis protein
MPTIKGKFVKTSILRNLLFAFLGFGLLMGAIFPFFANFFVEWKDGMLVWFVVGALVAGISVGIINYWLVNTILLSKLRRISDVANAIGRNDITHHCSIKSADTLGEIVDSFNRMTENLRSLIGQVAGMSGNVSENAGAIQGLMSRVHGKIDGSRQSTQRILDAMNALSSTVGEIAEHAAQVADASRKASQLAKQGGHVVQDTVQDMQLINRSVSEAASAVDSLGRKSDEISAIVAVINGIAEQTNLLALNASIEAARAGEQGRGFAVVADEVRKLAEKTGSATQEIRTMIESIQDETRLTVATMENGTGQVREGVRKATEAGRSLQEIVVSVESVSAMIDKIASGAAVQNQMADEVLGGVEEIVGMIDEIVHDTKTSEGLSNGLAAQSAELDQVVKQFKLC